MALSKILRDKFFAILVDKSIDISMDKGLAINIRYVDSDNGRVQCKFWDIVRIFEEGKAAKATSQRLFDCICQSFQKQNVPLKNIFACCFDGCSTMVGCKNVLKTLLEQNIPGIVCIICAAHKTHLCATHSLDEIRNEILILIKNIKIMLKSANREHNFEELQKTLSIVTR